MPEATAALALAFGVVLAPLVAWWLDRRAVLDVPNERSSHVHPVPRGGGLAILAAATIAVVLADVGPSSTRLAFAAVPLAFGLLGLADDVKSVAARWRLLLQVAFSAVLAAMLTDHLTGPVPWRVVFTVGVAVWVVACANAFNFMDGINGLAGSVTIISGATWWVLGVTEDVDALRWSGAVLALAAVGFLPLNFPRARVFLGDVGSYFIGAWSAVVVVVGMRAGVAPEAMLAPLALFLADTAWTLIGRARRGESPMSPHRDHVYQRMASGKATHTRLTVSIAGVIVLCAALGVFGARVGGFTRAACDVGMAVICCAYLAAPGARPASFDHVGDTRPPG